MKKLRKVIFIALITAFILLFVTACEKSAQENQTQYDETPEGQEEQIEIEAFAGEDNDIPETEEDTAGEDENISEQEYVECLFITMTSYTNGENDDDGVNLLLYCYNLTDDKMEEIVEIPIVTCYPANCLDLVNGKLYYAAANRDEPYDNLFCCDLNTGEIEQLTFGKYLFNDMLIVDGKLYVNTARRYETVTQPAVFDFDTNTFTYLDEEDHDTWIGSMSYNYSTENFLIMTYSDAEMRTHRVAAETHIRPKTISLMDKELNVLNSVYFTEDFEIRLTRQLDENHVLMTAEPSMAGSPRALKLLTIDTQEVTDFEIPGIDQVYLFYPLDNGEGMFFIGKGLEEKSKWILYYYDMVSGEVSRVFEAGEYPEGFRSTVDIVYSIQPVSDNSFKWDTSWADSQEWQDRYEYLSERN